jgi:hypothetical protein
MRVVYRKIRHAPCLYIKRNVEKVWGARYTLGARYLSKNTVLTECNTTNFENDHGVQRFSYKQSSSNAVRTHPDTKRNIQSGLPLAISFLYGTYSIKKTS